ncbi:hypothetical protein SAMN05444266_101673 [Chitinophaga jiangningensis]|uniref:Uncharacterized protein n=1 Tax=Chitinophaga jiangningensis TaxID=1419482 RepID=A0A1M6WKR3_9BACT|nr:hypothetical protein SAMN05444266_101673 [Chitinophaga jiangningensis]
MKQQQSAVVPVSQAGNHEKRNNLLKFGVCPLCIMTAICQRIGKLCGRCLVKCGLRKQP